MNNRRFERLNGKIYGGVDDFEEIMNILYSENQKLRKEFEDEHIGWKSLSTK